VNTICTSRLEIRPFNDADTAQYIKIMSNPIVTKYLGSGKVMTTNEISVLLDHFRAVGNNGFGVYAVIEKETKNLIGHCGIRPIPEDRVELLYAYDPAYWGKGYATEAGKAVLHHAKNKLNIRHVHAMSYPENAASIVVINKLGFTPIGTEEHFGTPLKVYELHL